MAHPGLFATFEPPNKLFLGPDKDLILLTDDELHEFMKLVCAELSHEWNDRDKGNWKCERCGKRRRRRRRWVPRPKKEE